MATHESEWPKWATEKISLFEPDADWARRGRELVQSLSESLKPWLVAGPHHVGSTAVQGLVAKPIIDIMAATASLEVAGEIEAALRTRGWVLVPAHLDNRPWRRFFVKAEGDRRVAHLHIMKESAERWVSQLRFRDALRANSELRRQYGELKRELAARYANDREMYSSAKASFITDAIQKL